MQIDIAAHIEKLLFEHETLIIPGFGGFTSQRVPAANNMVSGEIKPPAKTIVFNENLTVDDGILVHDISRTHGIGNDDARRAIAAFVEQTNTLLGQREIVSLSGVGRLYRNFAQKTIFIQESGNLSPDSYGLPMLQFSPLAQAREVPPPAPPQPPRETPAPAPAPAPPPPAETLPVPSIAQPSAAIAPPPPAAPPPAAPPPIERELRRDASPMRSMVAFSIGLLLFAIAVSVYLIKRSRAASANREAVVETRDERPAEQPPAALPTPGNLMAEGEKAAQNEAQKPAENPAIEQDNTNDDTADEVEEAASKRAQNVDNQSKKPSQTVADGEKRCVVIIGTYQKKENADKLLAKLRKAGYDTYYRVAKGHQVGAEFMYSDLAEIQRTIKSLQELTGEEEIWIKKR